MSTPVLTLVSTESPVDLERTVIEHSCTAIRQTAGAITDVFAIVIDVYRALIAV